MRFRDGTLRLAAGAAWRHYDAKLDSSDATADGLDLGVRAGYRF